MGEVLIGDYLLESDELYKEPWPKRAIHRCRHRTTAQEFLIKVWWQDAHNPVGTDAPIADFKPLFDNEVRTLLRLEKSSVAKYLPVLEKFSESSQLQKDNSSETVAYQLFKPIKHLSLFHYERKLPEQMRVHIFRHIVEFVVLLNEDYGLSVMSLHPSSIFLTESQLPCFINVMYTQKLSYSQEGTELHIENSFQCPEMLRGTRVFNAQRADSFQLGVLAMRLLCGTVCCQQKNHDLDTIYSHLMKQHPREFWQRLKCQDKPDKLKQMIQMLLQHEPVLRIDPYAIKLTEWWQLPCEAPPENTLAFIDQAEKEKKQQMLLQAKLRAQTRPARPPFVQPRTTITRNSRSISEDSFESLVYNSKDFTGCLFFPLRIYETYELLLDRMKHRVRKHNESKFCITLEMEDIQNPFMVKIRLFCHRDTEEITIVKLEFYEGDLLHCSDKYTELFDEIAHEGEICLAK